MKPDPVILYVLCGLSFAGKSTLARQLSEPLGASIVEADRFIAAVEAELPQATKLESWRAIQARARASVRALLTAGTSVLYDDLLVKPDVRDELVELARQSGAQTVVVYVDTPVEVIRTRQRLASSKPQKHEQWEAHTQLLLAQLVPPDPETSVYIKPGDALDDVLREIRTRTALLQPNYQSQTEPSSS